MAVLRVRGGQVRAGIRCLVRGEFFYGWVIVALAFLANFFSSGTGGYSLGLFFQPMHQSLGWDRTTLTLGPTLRRVINAFTAPFVGAAVDRFGPRIVMLAGPILVGATLAATGFVRTPWQFYLVYGGAGALGTAQLGSLVTGPALAKWFVRRRATAIAIAAMGVSMGGIVFIPVTQTLISHTGWRATWVITGLLLALLATPPTLIWMRNRPEEMGLLPDGEPVRSEADEAVRRSEPGERDARTEEQWTLREAIRTPALWLLTLAFGFGNMALGSLLLHQIPYMQERGYAAAAVPVSSFMAVAALVCKPGWGYVIDRFSVRTAGIVAYLLAAVGLLVLIAAPNVPALYLYSVLFGFGIGVSTMLGPIAWANYYGRRSAGTITGFAQPFQVVANAAAPLFAAYIDDATGSYRPAFLVFVATYFLGCLFLFLATPPRRSTRMPGTHTPLRLPGPLEAGR
jgi:OFA family oxalate/formate antiporter-like MFS transporter